MKIKIDTAIIFESSIFEEEFIIENTKEITLKTGMNQTFIFWNPQKAKRRLMITSLNIDAVRKFIIEQQKSA